MPPSSVYRPLYRQSHALVVGINNYRAAPPLKFARQDAEAVADCLASKFEFSIDHVKVLVDEQATRDAITEGFLAYTKKELVAPDDRLVVFFAGHGTTRLGKRGEVGFLVPHDGNTEDLASLIRWHDLTHNSELILGKHVLFIMDACYGGLALTRALAPGAARFARDMLQRYARQAVAAGKADEVVADEGGPLAGHSVFTGHLLEALEGKASTRDGLLSANNVMAYVYDRVAKDYDSRQTPHYGFLDGDGDLLFNHTLVMRPSEDEATKGEDVLIEVSPSFATPAEAAPSSESTTLKEMLSDPAHKIRLDDHVMAQVRAFLHDLTPTRMPGLANVTPEELGQRLRAYEDLSASLRDTIGLLAKWSEGWNMATLQAMLSRIGEREKTTEGYNIWIGLEWYPQVLLQYSGGIAALAAGNYRALKAILTTPVAQPNRREPTSPAIVPAVQGMLDVERANGFKLLPGYERRYTPRSDYMLAALQPHLEDLLFLGSRYEEYFDTFEVFWALVYADLKRDGTWGPPGRFCWKHSSRPEESPLLRLIEEAKAGGPAWPPLQQGLFTGSLERFLEISQTYLGFVNNLGWF